MSVYSAYVGGGSPANEIIQERHLAREAELDRALAQAGEEIAVLKLSVGALKSEDTSNARLDPSLVDSQARGAHFNRFTVAGALADSEKLCMRFDDFKFKSGLSALNDYLLSRSYTEGYQPSQADVSIFNAFRKKPADKYDNVVRRYGHIASYGDEMKSFPGIPKSTEQLGDNQPAAEAPGQANEDEDDDIDVFGSNSGDEAEA
ncbi:unnamed protein product [Calicophoron daubneyi]|uniref:Uncharacterized protein n=1 Tax=Calicophoron daubneyi TaxID=300641 RepID=A0AAV2T5K1_CALDB